MSNNRDYQIDQLGYEARERTFTSAEYGTVESAYEAAKTFADTELSGDYDIVSAWSHRNDGRGSRPDGYRVEWAEQPGEYIDGLYLIQPDGSVQIDSEDE